MVEFSIANFFTIGLISAIAIAVFQWIMTALGINLSWM
jgi:hypothetical protein